MFYFMFFFLLIFNFLFCFLIFSNHIITTITINKKTSAQVVAVDVSDGAIALAKENAEINAAKIEFMFRLSQSIIMLYILNHPPQ